MREIARTKTGKIIYELKCETCGRLTSGTVSAFRSKKIFNGKLVSHKCPHLNEEKLAAKAPLVLTPEQSREAMTRARAAINTSLPRELALRHSEDLVQMTMVFLCSRMDVAPDNIGALAYHIARLLSKKAAAGQLDDAFTSKSRKGLSPVRVYGLISEGEEQDIFDVLNVTRDELHEGDELEIAALGVLTASEKSFMEDFVMKKVVHTTPNKARFASLTAKIKEAHSRCVEELNSHERKL
jgi:hypothetical protein